MAKLAVFVACEKVITDEETHLVSLINLVTVYKVTLPLGERPPSNAVDPKEWAVMSAWDPEEGEGNRDFTQCMNIFFPDGKPFVEGGKLPFKMAKDKRTHNAMKVFGVPVGQQGRFEIQIWLELDGKPIVARSSIYVSVEHEHQVQ